MVTVGNSGLYPVTSYVWEIWDGRVLTTLNPSVSIVINKSGFLPLVVRGVTDLGEAYSGAVTLYVNQQPVISDFSCTHNNLVMPFTTVLSVSASDPEGQPLSYAWTQDGTPTGSNSPQLVVDVSGSLPYTSIFEVTITDGGGGITKAKLIISGRVNNPPVVSPVQINEQPQPPIILSQPQGTTIQPGDSTVVCTLAQDSVLSGRPLRENGKAIFTVFASDPNGDDSQLWVDWSQSSPEIVSAITQTNTYLEADQMRSDIWVDLVNVAEGDYAIICRVTDSSGAITQVNRLIHVGANNPPVIDRLAVSSQSVPFGASVYYTVIAHDPDNDPLTYDWFFNSVGPVASRHFNGPSVTYPTLREQDGLVITGYVIVSDNRGGHVMELLPHVGIGNYNGSPVITLQPISQSIGPNQTVTLCCSGEDFPPTPPPVITVQPDSKNVPYNASTLLTVIANNAVNYQWYQGNAGDTSTPVGSNLNTLYTPTLSVSTNYWVRVSNATGSVNSVTAVLTVQGLPTILSQPQSQTIGISATATLCVSATG